MAAEVERISQQHEQERAKLGLIMQVEQARQHKSLAEKREMRRRRRASLMGQVGAGGGRGGTCNSISFQSPKSKFQRPYLV